MVTETEELNTAIILANAKEVVLRSLESCEALSNIIGLDTIRAVISSTIVNEIIKARGIK